MNKHSISCRPLHLGQLRVPLLQRQHLLPDLLVQLRQLGGQGLGLLVLTLQLVLYVDEQLTVRLRGEERVEDKRSRSANN